MDTGATVTQIGKYPILGILGVGGMGVVYRGMDNSVGREVAIKTLTEATEELRQRFLMEARSGVLNHPNIVTVYDFGEQDGLPYIVMEYLPGDSLENLLRSGHKFSLIEKLDMIRQLCLGLGYAHQKGVIHRDIKPANMMVLPDGVIKIVDFGVARLQDRSGHTQTGMVIGTFHYISPERLLGKPADGRSDIWSAACILYLLLTGRLPFPGDDPATLHRVIREAHDPLSATLTDYPPALDHLIDRGLAKSPEDRYETAEEMAADIEAINDNLKREHVAEVLGTVRPLMEQEQWTSVRPVLLDLQKLNPQNTEVKKLLREVQEKVSRQQRSVQIRQLISDGDDAVLGQKYAEAIEFYNQAASLDRTNTELPEKIENATRLKEKADKVVSLLEQCREARKRNDYTGAGELIDKALQLDERNTDLRNERARILQESERAAKDKARRQFSDAARDQLGARQYTEAIKNLRSALEIDPTDAETQQLYQQAVERQEEQRRRKIIDQIVAEISECITANEFERALTLIQRAQERLPGEAVLLQLKADAETKQREQTAKKLVEKTSLHVYNVFLTSPQEALTAVHEALAQMPGEPGLIALEEKVVEQLKKASFEERKLGFLKQAQARIDAKQFDEAVQILESAEIECGESPDIASLLMYAREQHRKAELAQKAAVATRDAQALISAGELESAVALLRPVALETKDPSVEQLLRQATASAAELVRRIDAVVARGMALGDKYPEKALQFLSTQPQDIQNHPRVRELIAKLNAANEREQSITEAIDSANAALQRHDLRNGFNGLETAQRTHGNSERLILAIDEFKKRRAEIANQLLTGAIESATQAIQQEDRPRAAEALGKVADAAEFADIGLQASLKSLAKEAGKSAPKKKAPYQQAPTKQAEPVATTRVATTTAKAKPGLPLGLLLGVIAVLVLAAAGAGYWFFLRPAPVLPMGALELNATPYAEVVSVISDKGKAVALPAGDHWTPMRLDDVPAGNYTVTFKGPDGSTQQQQCSAALSVQICSIQLKPIDDNAIDQIVGGAK
jgi:serine/threonine-protein kinase